MERARFFEGLRGGGRTSFYFSVRYATPILVLIAVGASGVRVRAADLAVVLLAQLALTLLTHVLGTGGGSRTRIAAAAGLAAEVGAISLLVWITGGVGGPLTFLFTVQALAAGILVSSRAGARAIALSTIAILTLDIAGNPSSSGGALPHGLTAAAALWILGGAGTLFSVYNERELRRRNAELATIRRVSLDIEDSLSLDVICENLCRGVAEGFRFDAVAVLQPEGTGELRCVGSYGVTGAVERKIAIRGHVARATAAPGPVVVTGEDARRDASLADLLGPRGYVAVPVQGGLLVATRMGRRRRPARLRAHEVEALESLAHHARLGIANARLHQRVADLARRDPLTGLLNRAELQHMLETELARVSRYATMRSAGIHPSVVLIDVDYFKSVNDRHGHLAGDAVLKALATLLRSSVRSFDIVARYGGEEFALILPGTDAESAHEVVNRVRRAVSAEPLVTTDAGKKIKITISAGISSAPENGDTPDTLLKAADTALYRSKEDGRNRATHASETMPPVARVLRMDPKRRRGPGEGRARAGSRPARGRSSLPKPRTPRV